MIQFTAKPTAKLPAKVIGLESAYQPTLEQKISQLPIQPTMQQATQAVSNQQPTKTINQLAINQPILPEPVTVQAAQAQAGLNENIQLAENNINYAPQDYYLPYSGALTPNEIALVRRLIERNTGATVSV